MHSLRCLSMPVFLASAFLCSTIFAQPPTAEEIDRIAAAGPFKPTWESLEGYKIPEWYQDAKLGIFIHWGAYSVPAFGSEWYPRNMYIESVRHPFWQTDTAVSSSSWGYTENQKYKSPDRLVDDLVDIVSKNGCLLLNVGPRSDGTIPQEDQDILRAIGGWLKVNGEAIYESRPWKTSLSSCFNTNERKHSKLCLDDRSLGSVYLAGLWEGIARGKGRMTRFERALA